MVRWAKQWRPSITWMQPRLTSMSGERVVHFIAVEQDRALGDFAALGMQQVRDRLQGRGLAGAVGAEQRDDAAARHLERHALEHEDDVVVDHLDVVEREDDVRGGDRFALASTRHSRRPIRRHCEVSESDALPRVREMLRAALLRNGVSLRRLVASFRALRPAGVRLGAYSLAAASMQRTDLVLHRRDPVRRLDPLGAIPLAI